MTHDISPPPQPHPTPPTLQVYTLILDYAATGEGRTVELLVTRATSEDAALRRFQEAHYPLGTPRADGWTYFQDWVTVHPKLDERALAPFVAPATLHTLRSTLPYTIRFALTWHYNPS